MLTFEQIKELIQLVADNDLQSLEIERAGFRMSVGSRNAEPAVAMIPTAATPPAASGAAVAPTSAAPVGEAAPNKAAEPVAAEPDAEPEGHLLTSPIVGTFYEAPAPDAEPFVRVGDTVRKGQVLCIVEAMKLMNEIEADVDGEILEIFPKNAQPVEYGEPLFAIRER